MRYTIFVQIFASVCSLEESLLVAKYQSQSADFGFRDFTENCLYDGHRLASDYDSIQSVDTKHV